MDCGEDLKPQSARRKPAESGEKFLNAKGAENCRKVLERLTSARGAKRVAGNASYWISITRLPARSVKKRFPGGMTVVALYSVMMAGPVYFFSTRS